MITRLDGPTIFDKYPDIRAELVIDNDRQLPVITQAQLHSPDVSLAEDIKPESTGDAIITSKPSAIGVRVADCVAVLVYDPAHHAIAAIHSGWRGSKADVSTKALDRMRQMYHSDPKDLVAYISPAGQTCCYEVKSDVTEQFDDKFTIKRDGKLYLDNSAIVLDQLLKAGIPDAQIEVDGRCTIHNKEFPSFRREGEESGRLLATIELK